MKSWKDNNTLLREAEDYDSLNKRISHYIDSHYGDLSYETSIMLIGMTESIHEKTGASVASILSKRNLTNSILRCIESSIEFAEDADYLAEELKEYDYISQDDYDRIYNVLFPEGAEEIE